MASSYNELFGLGSHSEDAALEGWWKLQETAGTTAVDSSSNGLNGTLVNSGTDPTTTTGPNSWLPSAFDFDGADDRVSHTRINLTGNHSFLCFAKPDTAGDFILHGALGGAQFRRIANNNTRIRRVTGVDFSTPTWTTGAWHEVFWCYDVTTGDVTFSLNGTSNTQTGAFTPSGGGVYFEQEHIGSHQATNTIEWNGGIAGFACFSRKLTTSEAAEYFAGPEPLNTTLPTLTIDSSSWSGTVGTWDSQSNGTISYYWELRDAIASVVDSGTTTSTSISGSGSFSGDYTLYVRASNDGGFDSAEDSVSATETVGAGTPSGSGSINAVATLSGTGTSTRSGTGSISAVGSLDGVGVSVRSGSGSVDAIGSLAGVGVSVRSGTSTIDAIGTLTGVGSAPADAASGSGTIDVVATLSGVGTSVRSGSGSVNSIAALAGTGVSVRSGTSTINAVGTLSGVGTAPVVGEVSGSGTLLAVGSLDGVGTSTRSGSGNMNAVATLAGVGSNGESNGAAARIYYQFFLAN